jgi:AcrR family transcriptional regulator
MTPQDTADTEDSGSAGPPGLRERKKQTTRDKLHRAALELFAQQGYRKTRIAEIAAAADVSESTFFRYFESKEGVALEGLRRRAQAMIEAVCARPAHESPIDACLAVATSPESAGFRPNVDEAADFALLATTPALAPRAMAMGERFVNILAQDVARRLGEPVGSIRVRVQAHALNMASMAAMEVWLADPTRVDLQAASREALLELKRGF